MEERERHVINARRLVALLTPESEVALEDVLALTGKGADVRITLYPNADGFLFGVRTRLRWFWGNGPTVGAAIEAVRSQLAEPTGPSV